MKKIKTFIGITILIIISIVVIIINIISDSQSKISLNNTNENIVQSDSTNNDVYVTKSGKIEEKDENEINKVRQIVEEYFSLLNAFYDENNEYSIIYSKTQIREMLYNLTLKQENENANNFYNNFEIQQKAEYFFEEGIFKIEDEKIKKYFINVSALFEESEGLTFFMAIVYIDKENGSYSIFFGEDDDNFEYPEIDTIEKNINNEY